MAKAAAITRPNFTSVLDTPAGDVERPKPLPVGEYIWAVQANPKFDKSTKKQTDYVEFTLKCLEPTDSVDEEALDEWKTKKDGTKKSLQEATQRLTFYLTEGALYRLTDFFKHCGLDVDNSDASIKQLIPETAGCQVIGTIKHTSSEDGTTIYANIASTAPVEG